VPLVQGQLLQIDLSTHQVAHTFETVPSGQVGGSIWGSPSLDPSTNSIYVTTGNQDEALAIPQQPYAMSVVALDAATLAVKDSWQIPAAAVGYDSDWGTTPMLIHDAAGHQLVAASNKNGVTYAFDRSHLSAGPIWQLQIAQGGDCPECGDGSISSGAFDGSRLYVAGGTTQISGTVQAGSVRALDPATGDILWEHPTRGPVLAALATANGLVMDGAGSTFEVLDASTGAQLFSYAADGAIEGAPSIAEGCIYVPSSGGTLYAFGLAAPPATATSTASPSDTATDSATSTASPTSTPSSTSTATTTPFPLPSDTAAAPRATATFVAPATATETPARPTPSPRIASEASPTETARSAILPSTETPSPIPDQPRLRVWLTNAPLRPGDPLHVRVTYLGGATVNAVLSVAGRRSKASSHADAHGRAAFDLLMPMIPLAGGHGSAVLSVAARAGDFHAVSTVQVALSSMLIFVNTAPSSGYGIKLTVQVLYIARAHVHVSVSIAGKTQTAVFATDRNGRASSMSIMLSRAAQVSETSHIFITVHGQRGTLQQQKRMDIKPPIGRNISSARE
jgi:hypothetical protein